MSTASRAAPHASRAARRRQTPPARRAARWRLGLLALLGIVGLQLGAARPAAAAETYCVGGFEISGGYRTRDSCGALGNIHPRWHFHMFVQGPDGKCHACWDENDNTCETTFLDQHPEFRGISKYTCASIGAAPPESAQLRLENGMVMNGPPGAPPPGPPGAPPGGSPGGSPPGAPPGGGPGVPPETYSPPPPPPPPPPVNVQASIARVSSGPHGAGDSVQVVTQVTSGGRARTAQGGEIIVRGPDGKERARVPVRALPGGQVGATVKIPDSAVGSLQLEFQPRGISLSPDERLGSVTSPQFALRVSPCRLRGHILSPGSGEIVMPQTLIQLGSEVRDKSGARATPAMLTSGTKLTFVAERADGRVQKHDGTIDADGKVSGGLWLTPTRADIEEITLRLLGEGGVDGDLCPAAAVTVRLTKRGIGLDIIEPKEDGSCYIGKPCRIVARFKLPTAGAARADAEAWLRTPGLALVAKRNGDPVTVLQPTTLPSGERAYAGTFLPRHAVQTEIEVVARAGGQELSDRVSINIRDPIVLKLPSELDLGRVPVGSSWRINCKALDFAGSRGVEDQEFLMHLALPPGCKSRLGISDAFGRFLPLGADKDGERRLVLGLDRSVKICLEPPRCAGESLAPAILTVKPTSPDFLAEEATVRITWFVPGRGFLLCNLWWLASLGGGLLLVLIVLGFIRPYNFGVDDSVKIATKKEGLSRAVARRLRDLPGGRAGFYRSAATGLREDGSATDRLRTAQLSLHAFRGEILLRSPSGLSRMNPQTRKMDPVEIPKEGYALSRNTVYQVGSLFFQVA
ncbi:MAG: hypothetical protein U1A78_19580 [Polyangia bacterium]